MARARYTINVDDLKHATAYLDERLRLQDIRLRNAPTFAEASTAFAQVAAGRTSQEKARAVNAWCEQHLGSQEWSRLKTSIRQRRARWGRAVSHKTIVVSGKIHKLLTTLTARDGVTQAQVLDALLARALNSPGPRK